MGKLMAKLPLHPRLAHMIARGKDLKAGALAADLAAILPSAIPSGAMPAPISPTGSPRFAAARSTNRCVERIKSAAQQIRGLAGHRQG